MEELQQLLIAANRAIQNGIPADEVDAALDARVGLTRMEIVSALREGEGFRPEEQATTANLLRAAGQGASFGFLDELAGLGAAVVPGGRGYSEARDVSRERFERFREDHPVISGAAELAGGLAVPGLGVGAGVARATRGAGLLAPLAAGALTGAGGGALAGAGQAETLEEVPGAALRGGGIGGLLGGAIGGATGPAVVGAVPAAVRQLRGAITPEAAGIAAGRRAVREAGERAGISTGEFADILSSIEARRPGLGVPADVSEQFRRLTREQINEASGNIDDVIARIRARPAGQSERVAADIRELSGFGTRTAREAEEAIEGRLRDLGRELFEPIAKVPIDDARLTDFIAQRDIAPLFRRVRPRAQADDVLTFQTFQALRRELRDEANELLRRGRTEGAAQARRNLGDLDAILEDIVPEFRAINLQFATTAEVGRAFGAGARAAKRNLTGDQVSSEMSRIAGRAGPKAGEALEAFRHGMVDEIITDVLSQSTNRNVAQRFINLGSQRRAALRQSFPSDDAFSEFIERALVEDRFSALKNAALANSTTAAQTGDLIRSLRQGSTLVGAFMREITSSPVAARARANEIARLLLTPGQINASEVAQLLTPPSIGSQIVPTVGQAAAPVSGILFRPRENDDAEPQQ